MTKEDDSNRGAQVPKSSAKDISDPGRTPGPPATNPFSHDGPGSTGGTGNVNPAAPSAGTEAWGVGTNEGQAAEGSSATTGANTERSTHTAERTFRCADAGNASCRWEASGRNDDELMERIERHGRDAHGMTTLDTETRRKFQQAIRERRPA